MEQNKTIKSIVDRQTTHLAGVFSISADGSFLNGAGLGSGEDKNKSIVKYYWRDKKIPYISSQAWRRWLRNTLIDNTNWPQSNLEAIEWNQKGNTSKIAGQLDPIEYPEDDIFGYMYASPKKTKEKDERLRRDRLPTEQLVRSSPFKSSLLRGVPDLIIVAEDDGYVHLPDDTPLPYTTQFYSGELQALFGLEVYRLGVFERKGKTNQELDPFLLDVYSDKLSIHDHPIYKDGSIAIRNDLITYQNELTSALVKSIARLNGGSKLAQFATDVAPKLLILAGLNAPHLLFDNLLISKEGKPALHLEALKEIVSDYDSNFTTPLFIGIRSGYLVNEDEIRALDSIKSVKVVVGTPISVAEEISKILN